MTKIVRLDAPIVVGAGVAGLSVALGLDRSFVISSKEMGSTWWAQGGIAVALGAEDSPQAHAADTVAVSGGLAVDDAVAALTGGGPEAVTRLIELGAQFDRDDEGQLLLSREGGHNVRRVVHADGDATGAEVMRALTEATSAAPTVETIDARVVDLARSGDRVVGVLTADGKKRVVYTAPAVVMATGGAGRMYARTTNPPGVTGDGIIIAARAGARLADLEFVQFHPTALNAGKDPMPLLTEALRGEGAKLVDASGRRFMDQYHPMAELAPRDIVARAIFWLYDRGSAAYLDARTIVNFHERFPTVTAHAMSVGLDPTEDLLPVSPAAHYYMGGIDADTRGRTSIPGLWAVGECASTGVHGANRLASNSLLEGLVFGARVAVDVDAQATAPNGDIEVPKEGLDLPVVAGPVIEDLRQVMWDRVGLIRTGDGLWAARNAIIDMEPVLRRTIGGRNAAELALLIIMSALRRSESRGGHYRADYPEEDPMQAMRALVVPGATSAVRVA
ncbi:MAG TPA: L-aspartate oxidase [Acidimicrobiia bacterium]|nr:L-aspartate oxidase [Acidimicrobiia bacterium]